VNVALLQWDLVWENPQANFTRAGELLAAAPPEKGGLLVLPETLATGFSMNREVTDEPEDGPTRQLLTGLAQEYGICALGGRVCAGNNEAIAVGSNGASLCRYAKQRPFLPGGEVYTSGSEPACFTWGEAQVAPFICYDLRFPELFREAARRWKPEIFVVIASWPEVRVEHWLALLRARAIENQAFVIGVNRTGTDPHFRYPGRSVVFDHSGVCLADAGAAEGVTTAPLNLPALREYRARLPFLEDLQ
jgi:omega-amidase